MYKCNICLGATACSVSRDRVSKSYSGEETTPLSNIYSDIYKTKTTDTCFQLLKIITFTSIVINVLMQLN